MADCGRRERAVDREDLQLPEADYDHLDAISDANSSEIEGTGAAPRESGLKIDDMACSEYILGTLIVRVAAAKYLSVKDEFSLGSLLWNGGKAGQGVHAKRKSSPHAICPYAKLRFGDNVQRTAACYDNSEPEWPREEQYYFDVALPVPNLSHLAGHQGEKMEALEVSKGTIFEHSERIGSGGEDEDEWAGIPPPPKPILSVVLWHSEMEEEIIVKKGKKKAEYEYDGDVFLGSLSLDVTQVLTGKIHRFDKWIALGGAKDIQGEVRLVIEYDSADAPPRHGDLCRFTGFCRSFDLYPAPAEQIYRVDDLDGDNVILSYTSPEGWLCTFKAHRYMLICADRHQAAVEKYEAEIADIIEKLAHSPLIHTVKETVDRLEEDGLLNVGREAIFGGVGLLNRWLEGGVDTAMKDVVFATNWDGQHNPLETEENGEEDLEAEEDQQDDESPSPIEDEGRCEANSDSEDQEEKEALAGMPCCPITGEPMRNPVVAADGHTYERKAIKRWLRESNRSPMTGATMPHKEVVTNYMLLSSLSSSNSEVKSSKTENES